MAVPEIVLRLVERFTLHRDDYEVGYNETQLRREFVDPLCKALGWDIDNEQGFAEAYKDVIHEASVKVGGATKAPDYCFRVGGTRKFFLEAKKPAENVKEDRKHAFQLRRYAWSAKLPLSILTNFAEFAVYDCRIKPDEKDKASVARVKFLTCEEYADRWDEISGIFSRDAVLKGSFDRYAESNKKKRGTSEVDAAFLADIEDWRLILARNLAARNANLSQRDLNFAVQRIIDRIVFLRIAEDRGIEDYGRLQTLLNGDKVYRRLGEIFRRADERYNSGLFHFEPEKGRHESPDELTLSLKIDDDTLKDIFRALYYPQSPYEFSVLPADILGQVYEQFLGKVIRLTEGHRAVVEEKPEVKKAGGVYYTPTYIVDYIVRQTVGTLVEGKTPKQVAKLRVLDPACGSGSFLIGAYQFLLDWHCRWYTEHDPKKYSKQVFPGRDGVWRLTTAERKQILLNNIYGVDIDSQAVEVTKLSLLLKVLEGENRETIERQRKLFHERALPDLGDNIKCGNSLIGPDFYNQHQMNLFDDDERLRINVFDWNAEFPAIMKSGGFDAVIGNPPWGASFSDAELAYFRRTQREVIARMIDSYIYFINQANSLAQNRGLVGLIVPSTLLNQVDARPIRELLIARGICTLINLGQGVFGRKVLNTSTIFVSRSQNTNHAVALGDFSSMPLHERSMHLQDLKPVGWGEWTGQVLRDPHRTFFVSSINGTGLLDRLRQRLHTLASKLNGRIQRGVSPDVVAAHVISSTDAKKQKLERELLRPSISGSQISRYKPWYADQLLICTTRATPIQQFPMVAQHLRDFRKQNTCKEVVQGKHPWWSLHRPRDGEIFKSPKFIGLTTSTRIELVYDEDSNLVVTDAMYVFSVPVGYDPWGCLAMLHSKTFAALYRIANQGESRVIPQVKASKLDSLPIPSCDANPVLWTKLSRHCKQILDLHGKLVTVKAGEDRKAVERLISATDSQIDRLVYELYGLTEDEIHIVEEAAVK